MKYGISIFGLAAIVLAISCSPAQQETVEVPELAEKVDFSGFPEDLHRLEIGVICTWSDYPDALESIRNLDEYDNITGNPGKDGIPDFAGEHFTFVLLRDSTASQAVLSRQCLKMASILLSDEYNGSAKERAKTIIIASAGLADAGLENIGQALSYAGTEVTVTGVDEFTSRQAAAMICYSTLRQQHNLALRTTPQVVNLIMEPPFEFDGALLEMESTELDKLECTPLQ